MLDGIDTDAYSPQPLLDLLERHGAPEWPDEVPWFEHQNHFLKPHGLCLVTLAHENIHVLCLQNDPAEIDRLQALLTPFGLTLVQHPPMSLAKCRQWIKQHAG
jgi:hypothetical protein